MALYFCEAMGRVVSMAFFISMSPGLFETPRPQGGDCGKRFHSRERPEKKAPVELAVGE